MVLRAMNSGVSGLRAEGEALGIIGDNIANGNTVGFKRQRGVFEDVLGHSILAGSGSAMPGAGVRMGDIQQIFTQGSLANTGVNTDLALNGDGFFVVKGSVDGINGNFYTRAGEFVLNRDGKLVNPAGLQVQGYAAAGDGTFAASPTTVQAPTSGIPAKVTSLISFTANLDSSEAVNTAWNAQDPDSTANFSISTPVFDSLGNAHSLNTYFVKTAANTWDYHVVADATDITGATGNKVELGTGGTLTFGEDGTLAGDTGTPLAVDFTGGAQAGQAISLSFGTPTAAGGSGLDGLTQFSSPSNTSSISQDGYASGDFSGIAVDGQGIVTGLYTNGEKIAIAQLSVAKFRSNDGLGRAGQGLWVETRDSGTAALGTASSGGRGSISSGTLEGSNVDLAEEFVGLIQHQRSFSANSKTITTADEMLQELINIKR